MRICRFNDDRFGVTDGRTVRDVTEALDVLPTARYPFPREDALVANLGRVLERVHALAPCAPQLDAASVRFLSPIANPPKIVGAPVNYQKHLEEVKGDAAIHAGIAVIPIHRIGLFLKSATALVGPSEGIALRMPDRRSDHEVELAVIIGRRADNVPRADALRYVAGYSIALDITVRGAEERSLRKSIDSYAVLGPWMVTADEIPDPNDLALSLSVNGALRQDSNTRHMILGVAELIEYASRFYTLLPGDILITGTPDGVSPIYPGDVIAASIERIGSMEVRVRAAE
jgi:2-keto-4-pentenoate hydratase/2-oxohepta-3-ene-1,7-dioic acid hydratase in catechol pathway